MSASKNNGAIVIKAFKKLRPNAKNIVYDYESTNILCQNVETYPTQEELDVAMDEVINEVIANEGRLENLDPYDLIYKNMWDGDYSGTDEWQVLKELEIGSGIYMIQLDAHTRHTGKGDYSDPDGGQFGVFFDGIEVAGGLELTDNLSGGCWTNVADLSETDKEKGGERNNGNQTLLISIPRTTSMSFRGRTPDADRGGIKMRMRTTVYKLGEV